MCIYIYIYISLSLYIYIYIYFTELAERGEYGNCDEQLADAGAARREGPHLNRAK